MTPGNGLIEPLFGTENSRYGIGRTEKATVEAIEEMNAANPFDPAKIALAEVARALAENIDAGNGKRRSVGNEAAQLIVVLGLLSPAEEAVDESTIPNEVKEFMHALGRPPQLAPGPGPTALRHSA